MSSPINPKYPLFLKNIGNKSKTTNVTHEELVNLRNGNRLIPGMQYRITDYVATTSDPESRSANHPFDIIVTADDTNVLNENARAIQHEGDEYFKNCNLAAWKLKYCLDNDINRFIWAQKGGMFGIFDATSTTGLKVQLELLSNNDITHEGYPNRFGLEIEGEYVFIYSPLLQFDTQTICIMEAMGEGGEMLFDSLNYIISENGKGVIYEMIDEHNNRAPYDFKGIQFKRYNGTINKNGHSINNIPNINMDYIDIDHDNFKYVYLCCTNDNFDLDMSVERYYTYAQNYYISNYNLDNIMRLPNITIDSGDFGTPNKVFIGENSYNISLFYNKDIYIGNECWNIINNIFDDYINIKSNSHNLINVHDCERYCSYIYTPYDSSNVKFMNSTNDISVGDIYILDIPSEVYNVVQYNQYKKVILWFNIDKLIWYHPILGTIETDM